MTRCSQIMLMPPAAMRSAVMRVIKVGALGRDVPAGKVRLFDLCRNGCRLRGEHGLEKDDRVRLEIKDLFALDAWVEWVCDDEVGCRFETPLDESVLGRLVVAGHRASWEALCALQEYALANRI